MGWWDTPEEALSCAHATIVLVFLQQAWTAALACSGGDAEERARVQTNLALALSALLRFEEALSAAESAVERDPTWEKVCDGRLAVERQLGL